MNFKHMYTLDQRLKKRNRIFDKYPHRVPIIMSQIGVSLFQFESIEKKIFLVPCDLTIGQFSFIIRRKINLTPEKALFLFVNGIIPPNSSIIGDINHKNNDVNDKFLYIEYSGENTFGGYLSIKTTPLFKHSPVI